MWILSSQEHLIADPSFFTQPLKRRQYFLLLTFWSLLLGLFLLVSFLSFWHREVEATQGSFLCLFLCTHFSCDLIQFHGFNIIFRIMSLKCMSPALISPSVPHSLIHFPIPYIHLNIYCTCPKLIWFVKNKSSCTYTLVFPTLSFHLVRKSLWHFFSASAQVSLVTSVSFISLAQSFVKSCKFYLWHRGPFSLSLRTILIQVLSSISVGKVIL